MSHLVKGPKGPPRECEFCGRIITRTSDDEFDICRNCHREIEEDDVCEEDPD